MKEEELKKLIEKYYNGESTEDEERTLRDHFRHNYLPEWYEHEKVIFDYYTESEEVPVPSSGFEKRIIAAIDQNENRNGILKVRRSLQTVMSVAAGLLLLMGSYFILIHKSESKDTFSSPEIAYAETVKILFDVSSRLNHGTQTLEPVIKMEDAAAKSFATISKSTSLINNNLKNLDYFQRALIMVYSPLDITKHKKLSVR
jgi:hypothetical protein